MKTNLRELRKSQNLSTAEVAEALGISLRTYQNYENGSTEMGYALILKAADFFGCSIDYLLCHQTQNLVYTSGLSKRQISVLKDVVCLNEEQLLVLEGFLFRLKQEQQNSQ